MATSKITVTLKADQVNEVQALVAAGKAGSVFGFVQHAVGLALNDVAGWQELLRQALEESGGPLTAKERKWAQANLRVSGRRKNAKRRNAA